MKNYSLVFFKVFFYFHLTVLRTRANAVEPPLYGHFLGNNLCQKPVSRKREGLLQWCTPGLFTSAPRWQCYHEALL